MLKFLIIYQIWDEGVYGIGRISVPPTNFVYSTISNHLLFTFIITAVLYINFRWKSQSYFSNESKICIHTH